MCYRKYIQVKLLNNRRLYCSIIPPRGKGIKIFDSLGKRIKVNWLKGIFLPEIHKFIKYFYVFLYILKENVQYLREYYKIHILPPRNKENRGIYFAKIALKWGRESK
jgi:hypothetical protein